MIFDFRLALSLLILFNFMFLLAVWHMSHNFTLKEKEFELTRGIFKIKREDAYRFSEYLAILAFFLTDMLFIYMFVK